jgi:hypothetical protein
MTRKTVRILPVALTAVLVLGACGSDDDTAEGTLPPVTSADSGLLAPRPIKVSGAGGNGSATLGAAPAAESADARSMDMSLMPYRITTFVAGDGLVLPTNDVGYVFEAGATVTAEQVAQLAAGLGVSGEPERVDDGYSTWWRVGPDDGTAPSLMVYEDAQLGWNYSSAWATQSVSVGCAIAEPAVGVAVDAVAPDESAVTPVEPTEAPAPECTEPEPPVGVLTADEAEARVRELMTAIGLDPSTFTFEPYADEWYASVSATEQLDGAFAGRRFDAGFGAEGVLQYAGGQLAMPVKVGPYPLVDLDTAIARLNDPSGFYGGYGGYGVPMLAADGAVARGGVATDAAVAVDVAEAPVSIGSVPGETMPVPEPEQVTVTLTSVEADVWWAWDTDGSVWLLPAYRFIGDDGGWYTVRAVTDEFLVQVPVEPVPAPEPMPVEPVPGTEPGGSPGAPTEPAVFDTTQLELAVGTSLDEFTKLAESLGATVRIVQQDGTALAVTEDYSTTRVNVAVEGSTVTAIVNVG